MEKPSVGASFLNSAKAVFTIIQENIFVKIIRCVLIGGGLIPFATRCISNPMALAPVGPDAGGLSSVGLKGYLRVFSATVKSPPITNNNPIYFKLHTGYDINDASGKCVKYVANHMSNMDEGRTQSRWPLEHTTLWRSQPAAGW